MERRSVTHILGLRAFGSPLLTEQIIGRGLRRTNYDVLNQPLDERPEGYEETADAFGIPFVGFPVQKRKRPQDRELGAQAGLDRAGWEEGQVPCAGAQCGPGRWASWTPWRTWCRWRACRRSASTRGRRRGPRHRPRLRRAARTHPPLPRRPGPAPHRGRREGGPAGRRHLPLAPAGHRRARDRTPRRRPRRGDDRSDPRLPRVARFRAPAPLPVDRAGGPGPALPYEQGSLPYRPGEAVRRTCSSSRKNLKAASRQG